MVRKQGFPIVMSLAVISAGILFCTPAYSDSQSETAEAIINLRGIEMAGSATQDSQGKVHFKTVAGESLETRINEILANKKAAVQDPSLNLSNPNFISRSSEIQPSSLISHMTRQTVDKIKPTAALESFSPRPISAGSSTNGGLFQPNPPPARGKNFSSPQPQGGGLTLVQQLVQARQEGSTIVATS